MYALNATNGEKLWNYTVGTPKVLAPFPNISSGNLDSSPTVVDGVVYAASDNGNVYAFNSTSGAKLWGFTTGKGTLSTPAVYDGIFYVGSSDDSIYALNATTGAKLWNYSTGGSVGSPVVVNGILYVGGGNNVYALRVSSASSPSPKLSRTLPIVVGGTVAVVIVAMAVFLMFRKRVKTKPTS
jgi:outer membrane protein assembly factor BamB